MRIALATAIAATGLDPDQSPLLQALEQAGVVAEVRAWDDPTVSWARYDLVVLRSTWDYISRHEVFVSWCEQVAARTRLLNPPEVVRWNTDKRYLRDLQAAGVAIVDSYFLAPGEDPHRMPQLEDFVVKPCVGAGSRDARRFDAQEREAAVAHAAALLDAGRHVLVQPYLAQVDEAGETALIHFDGEFSHAIRKGALLGRGGVATSALYAPERIEPRTPSSAERRLAEQVLAAQPFGTLAYARIDLLPAPDGPRLLELELCEPSLFFGHAPGSADRFAQVLVQRARATPGDVDARPQSASSR